MITNYYGVGHLNTIKKIDILNILIGIPKGSRLLTRKMANFVILYWVSFALVMVSISIVSEMIVHSRSRDNGKPLLTEKGIRELIQLNDGDSPSAIRSHAKEIVKCMQLNASKNELTFYYYAAARYSMNEAEGLCNNTYTYYWKRERAEKVRDEMGKYLPIEALRVKCETEDKCFVSFHISQYAN